MATTTTAPKAANVGVLNYAPGTRVDWTVTVPDSYDLGTVTAVFELLSPAGVVTFRYSSGVDTNLSITDQVLTVALEPDATSEDDLTGTPETILLAGSKVRWNLDLGQTGSDVVDYRIQGVFECLPEHGGF